MQLEATKRRDSSSQQLYFSGLVELHEANYIRLRRLLPDLGALEGNAVSIVPAGLDLHFKLLEKCKYTTTFSLSYIFDRPVESTNKRVADTSLLEGQSSTYRAPDLQVRMYQDAQLAEVISGVLHKHYLVQDSVADKVLTADSLVQPQMDALYARWKLNRFLYRWLGFCLKQGHQFKVAESLQTLQQGLIAKLKAS